MYDPNATVTVELHELRWAQEYAPRDEVVSRAERHLLVTAEGVVYASPRGETSGTLVRALAEPDPSLVRVNADGSHVHRRRASQPCGVSLRKGVSLVKKAPRPTLQPHRCSCHHEPVSVDLVRYAPFFRKLGPLLWNHR